MQRDRKAARQYRSSTVRVGDGCIDGSTLRQARHAQASGFVRPRRLPEGSFPDRILSWKTVQKCKPTATAQVGRVRTLYRRSRGSILSFCKPLRCEFSSAHSWCTAPAPPACHACHTAACHPTARGGRRGLAEMPPFFACRCAHPGSNGLYLLSVVAAAEPVRARPQSRLGLGLGLGLGLRLGLGLGLRVKG